MCVWQLSRNFTNSRKLDNLNDLARNLANVGLLAGWTAGCYSLNVQLKKHNYHAVYAWWQLIDLPHYASICIHVHRVMLQLNMAGDLNRTGGTQLLLHGCLLVTIDEHVELQ